MSTYKFWIGHVNTTNLKRVVANRQTNRLDHRSDGVNFHHRLEIGSETEVECLRIVDIALRPQFHFIVRV